MRVLITGLAAMVAGGAVPTPVMAQDATVRQVVERFEAARAGFDQAALAATLAPQFEEISPAGEVDSREKVLGFYAPEAKRPAPPMTTDAVTVQTLGDTAIVTSRISMTIPGAPAPRAIRARYVVRAGTSGWQLVSAQYTPMR